MQKRYKLGAAAITIVLTAGAAQAAIPAARAAVGPSVVAVSQVENLNNTVRGETGSYAGLWIDHKTNTVYVSATSASVTAATVAALEPRAASRTATMRLVVVHAKYNFAQLASIAGRVMNDKGLRNAAKASHSTLSQWYPDPITDKIVIGFTKVTPAERAEVRAEYGTTARVIAAPIAYAAVGKWTSKTAPRTARPASRSADAAPWYGGDELTYDSIWHCSSGYEFGTGSMSTAGHCGGDPTTFYNNGNYVGTTLTVQWGNGRIDMERINGSTYLPYIWAGSGGETPEPVSGSGGVALGGYYCTGGYVTVQNCSATVDKIDVCQVMYDDYARTDIDYCDMDQAYSYNSTKIVQGGDSGGPVYTNTSIYDPYAVGTISGSDNTGTIGFWSDMYMEKEIFHLSPNVG